MNKPKIIFFDVDGTLVPLKGAARPRTLEALRRLHQNGIRLCIATGRAPMEVPKFEGVSFDAFLTYNGSYMLPEGIMTTIAVVLLYKLRPSCSAPTTDFPFSTPFPGVPVLRRPRIFIFFFIDLPVPAAQKFYHGRHHIFRHRPPAAPHVFCPAPAAARSSC